MGYINNNTGKNQIIHLPIQVHYQAVQSLKRICML